MKKRRTLAGALAAFAVVAATMVAAAPASAFSGDYAKFNFCPTSNPTTVKCIYSSVNSGEVVLGKKKVPIVNPVVLQGGITEPSEIGNSTVVAATNGVTLSKSPQPVPGGLAGLVNCKEIGSFLLRVACEGVFENGFTGVNSTVELARPANEIIVNEGNVLFQNGVAFRLPVKTRLENPLLGSSCYIGSSSSPIIWNLTTGTTAPPAPNTPISGSRGTLEEKGEGGILRLNGVKLVDNAWSAPGATGCGGFGFELLLNPIINASVGVPSPAGKNTAIQIGVADSSPKSVVLEHP